MKLGLTGFMDNAPQSPLVPAPLPLFHCFLMGRKQVRPPLWHFHFFGQKNDKKKGNNGAILLTISAIQGRMRQGFYGYFTGIIQDLGELCPLRIRIFHQWTS